MLEFHYRGLEKKALGYSLINKYLTKMEIEEANMQHLTVKIKFITSELTQYYLIQSQGNWLMNQMVIL